MRFQHYLAVALLVSLSAENLVAKELPQDVRVPVIAVDAGRKVEKREIDAVIGGFSSPSIRGVELKRRLGIPRPLNSESIEKNEAAFVEGQDLFFSGRHQEAESKFIEFIHCLETSPAAYAQKPSLRRKVFMANLHLAVIARGMADEERVEKHLRRAAARFPELMPDTSEFPPWVCERFDSARRPLAPPAGEIHLEGSRNCGLVLSGRDLGTGTIFKEIESGEHAVQASCDGITGPVQLLTVGEKPSAFAPLITGHSRLLDADQELRLVADSGATEESLLKDTLAVARAGGWSRLVAVIGLADGVEVWLVDVGITGIVRKVALTSIDNKEITEASRVIAPDEETIASTSGIGDGQSDEQPWHKDGPAWTLVGAGAAALGTGIALRQVYGSSSQQETWAAALMIAGAGAIGTGTVLFFIPVRAAPNKAGASAKKVRGLAVGLATGVTF